MKKIEIVRETFIEEVTKKVIKMFRKKGYEITFMQALSIVEINKLCDSLEFEFSDFETDWKECK